MVESVDAGCMGHIKKNDWCAVNKAPGRNRSREGVLDRRVCAASTHAALLAADGFLFRRVLLRQPGVLKKDCTRGLHCGGEENAPRLEGSGGWHQAPNGSFNPKGIFAQSWQAGLTCEKKDGELYCEAQTIPLNPGRRASCTGCSRRRGTIKEH